MNYDDCEAGARAIPRGRPDGEACARNCVTRKEFIAAGAAFAGGAGRLLAGGEAPELRVGIISDIHVSFAKTSGAFEKALRIFDKAKVDAILIAGDLINYGMMSELEVVANTWRKVFPEDKRSDGVQIEKLLITGNHDIMGFLSRFATKIKSHEDVEKLCFIADRKKYWRELFGEEYEPISMKTVKGYRFILRNWYSFPSSKTNKLIPPGIPVEKDPTPDFMAKVAGELPADRPFFYVQHEYMAGTVLHKLRTMDQEFDSTSKLLSSFPNCLALTGHSHFTLIDERSIWQGGFTVVNCSSGGGVFTPMGRENGRNILDYGRNPPFEMGETSTRDVKQALVMDVFSDRISFRRIDTVANMTLGADWVVPLFGGRTVPPSGAPKYDFASRAASSVAPQFAPGSKVEVKEIDNGHRRTADGRGMDPEPRRQIVVSFPPVVSTANSERAFDFSVTAEMQQGDKTWTCIVEEKRVYSPNFSRAESLDVAPVECAFARDRIPKKRDIRFVVRPFNCWGKSGEPISSEWVSFMSDKDKAKLESKKKPGEAEAGAKKKG